MSGLGLAESINRRSFLASGTFGLGSIALGTLLNSKEGMAGNASSPSFPNFTPKAKRVIYLFQAGGPSQLDLLDYKPELQGRFDEDIPESVFGGQRITGMVASQDRLPVVPTMFNFQQCGSNGTYLSELLPHTQKVVDDLCIIKTMYTEAINHDPAITLFQTGSQQPGRPSMGAWVNYGLGNANENLPAFVVLISVPSKGLPDQGLLARLWGTGFLPSKYQGVQFRSSGDPVLYISDPKGMTREQRRLLLDGLAKLNHFHHDRVGDPEIESRIAQYEMAYRMQTSVPELTDLSNESEETYRLYGDEARKPGTFARNCLLARRLAERGVRFIQLYHRGWDQHGGIHSQLPIQAHDTDQASAALISDLKRRGLLEDTLVVWGGEFGRTPYAQGSPKPKEYGRDHHGRAFSIWMAGGGVKPGAVYGQTDEYGFNIVEGEVHVHDLQATILHLLGMDHKKLTYPFQGRAFRLTDVHGNIVHDILA